MTISRRPRGRTCQAFGAAVAALALAAVLGACAGSDEPDPAGDETASTGSTTGSTTAAADDPTSSSGPTAEPATGPVLRLGKLSIRLPESWKPPSGSLGGLSAYGIGPNHRQSIGLSRIPEPHPEQTVDEQAQDILDHPKTAWVSQVGTPVRKTDVTIDGEPAYYMVGREGHDRYDEIGLIHGGNQYKVFFRTYLEFVHEKVAGFTWEEVIDSVLASAEWSG